MGVDCRIILPGNVRLGDIQRVIGVAVGFKPSQHELRGGGVVTDVFDVQIRQTDDPSYLFIHFDGRQCYFSFEPSEAPGKRLLAPTSTPFWCLVGQRLVDFFGGSIDYNDCDAVDIDYSKKEKPNSLNCPTNDPEWSAFHNRIMKVKPITNQELNEFKASGLAGYSTDDNTYYFDSNGRMVR